MRLIAENINVILTSGKSSTGSGNLSRISSVFSHLVCNRKQFVKMIVGHEILAISINTHVVDFQH